MKSEHRHELKTNELAEWIANLPQWAKKNLKMIIYVSIVVVLVAGAAFIKWYGKNVQSAREQLEFTDLIARLPMSKSQIIQAQTRGIDYSYTLIQIAKSLQTTAQTAKNDDMAALALIKRAQILRMELHYRLDTANKQELEATINRAKAAYTKALKKSSSNPTLTAMAKFGLGLCEEELGNFDKARQIYQEIATNADFEATTAAVQAKLRLETMADYRQKVVFKASPKPVPLPPVKPRIELSPDPASALPTLQSPNELKIPQVNLQPQTQNDAFSQDLYLPYSANEAPFLDINLPSQ